MSSRPTDNIKSENQNEDRSVDIEFTATINTSNSSNNNINLQNISGLLVEGLIDISGILEYFNNNTINFDSISVSNSLEVGNLEFINSSQNADFSDISSRLNYLESSFNELSIVNNLDLITNNINISNITITDSLTFSK